MMKRMVLSLGALVAISCLPVQGLDLENTELVNVYGTVQIKKSDMPEYKEVPKNLKLAGGLKRLDSGDKVKTADESGAEMVLKETCLLTVKENSQFEVPKVIGQGLITQLKTNKGSYLFKVISGSDFKVQTADVVAGVKGTLFEVEAVDDLRTMLSTPNMDLGVEGGGGTNINVYEGEVELKHVHTGKIKRLKPGEGIAALGKRLSRLDQALSDGFTPMRSFKPLERLEKRFGALGKALHGIPSNRLGIGGFTPGALKMPLGKVLPGEGFGRMLEGVTGPLKEKLEQFRPMGAGLPGIGQKLQNIGGALQDIKGEAFVPQFSPDQFPVQREPVVIGENQLREVHLGNGVFISAMPDQGCSRLKMVPGSEGMQIAEGEGTFRIRDLSGELDGIVTLRQEQGQLVSQVNLNKGDMSARLRDEQTTIPVRPNNPVAVRMTQSGRQERTQPREQNIPTQIREHRFAAESQVEAQKAQHQKVQNEKRGQAAKTIMENLPEGKRPNLDLLKNLGQGSGLLGNRQPSGNQPQGDQGKQPANGQPQDPSNQQNLQNQQQRPQQQQQRPPAKQQRPPILNRLNDLRNRFGR